VTLREEVQAVLLWAQRLPPLLPAFESFQSVEAAHDLLVVISMLLSATEQVQAHIVEMEKQTMALSSACARGEHNRCAQYHCSCSCHDSTIVVLTQVALSSHPSRVLPLSNEDDAVNIQEQKD